MVMADLALEIAAYKRMQRQLEAEHSGEWVLVHDEELVDLFATFEEAADVATQRFGRGPYLIREIGSGPVTLPASVVYRPLHA